MHISSGLAVAKPFLGIHLRSNSSGVEPESCFPRRSHPAPRTTMAKDLANALVNQTPNCIEVVDRLGHLLFVNPKGVELLGMDRQGLGSSWVNNWMFDSEAEASAAMAAVQTGQCAQFEAQPRGLKGAVRRWKLSISEMTGCRSLVTSRDVTAEHEASAGQRLIAGELQHRIKNTLAMVQSLVSQTLREGIDVEDARRTLSDRLSALAVASDMLTRTDRQALQLATLATAAVSFIDGGAGRVVVDGPAVMIGPKAALVLTMALHELSTNAAKYGALSLEAGHVELSWRMMQAGGEPRVCIQWTEYDGPPVKPPVAIGFGSRLIGRVTERQLRGSVVLAFHPTGIVWTLDVPVDALAT